MPEMEPDLPLAFLGGYPRRFQPDHPDPQAQRGLTGYREGLVGGVTKHVEHTALHGTGIRAVAQVARPGSRRSDPMIALCDLMMRFDLAARKDLRGGWDACPGAEAHVYGRGTLVVDGVGYAAVELREQDVIARAAVVAEGWTVLACVPEGQPFPEVVTEVVDREAAV